MTELAEDPTEPTTAKQMQNLVTRSPALGAVRHLQSRGGLARVAEQAQAASAVQKFVAGSSALRAVEQLQSTLAASTRAQGLARPNPGVLEAAAKFQQLARPNPGVLEAAAKFQQLARPNPGVLEAAAKFQQNQVASLMPSVSAGVNAVMDPLQNSLRRALDGWMRQWADLARFGTGLARTLARGAIHAALRARRAVLHGRTDELDAFIIEWLDQPVTSWRRDAVAIVLLEDDWLATDLDFDDGSHVLHHIKTRASLEARNHKFIGETELRGHRVVMLDRPVQRDGATLADLLVDPSSRNGLPVDVGYDDDRLNMLLGRLKPDEQAVVIAYGDGVSETWESAAVAAGLPPEFGERVRRKCKRERDVIAARAAAGRATQPGLIGRR